MTPLRRFASSPKGDHTRGPAKPVPRCVLDRGTALVLELNSHEEKHMQSKNIRRIAVAGLLTGLAGVAQAHPGHGATSLMEGLAHPFGLDHLLAMVAVGVWSVSALPPGKAWQGPATFLLALVASAALGAAGVSLPFLEQGVALSVVLFGAMLVLARQPMPAAVGLGLGAAAASLHGRAHGAETG